jgi:uncharacterized damage-inducible protein DinB
MHSLHNHLKARTAAAYRQLAKSLAGLPPEDALRGADPRWRQYRHGIGLDGSIAGIVRHVATWKHAAAEGVTTGAFPSPEGLHPPGPEWADLHAWLEEGQARLVRVLEGLDPADLERAVRWDGQPLILLDVYTHLIEHDQYHAGQVNLLRQQWGRRLPE